MRQLRHLLIITSSLLPILIGCSKPQPQGMQQAYSVQTIDTPTGLLAETGGIDFMPDGRLVSVYHRGEVMLYDPKRGEWSVFAKGLHDPLGVLPLSNTEILVMQRPELTKISDTDGDGVADQYETVTDDFGMSGNYHEFAFGPESDGQGNWFISLNTASNGAGIREEIRGEFRAEGRPGRMYSCVPWRGWVMKVAPDGQMTPWASGFRSPNGLEVTPQGDLFVTDNQGDWLGTSKLYHVRKDQFYGHPASLVWEDGFRGVDPLTLPVGALNKMRTEAAVLFPHSILANSPTQPVTDRTEGKFGPFSGQLIVGEMDHEYLLRVMLEEVDGETQGACIVFLDSIGLRKGNNRLAFAPDGSLWIGQNDHGWVGDEGIQRVTWNGMIPFEILDMKLSKTGFDFSFTQELSPSSLSDTVISCKKYYYEYRRAYGSPQMDVQEVAVENVRLSKDRKKISIDLGKLTPGYVYEITWKGLQNSLGQALAHPTIFYTLNRLHQSDLVISE